MALFADTHYNAGCVLQVVAAEMLCEHVSGLAFELCIPDMSSANDEFLTIQLSSPERMTVSNIGTVGTATVMRID